MKIQTNTTQVTSTSTSNQMLDAIDIMVQSLHKRDHELRAESRTQGCEPELEDLRNHLVQHLQDLRNQLVN